MARDSIQDASPAAPPMATPEQTLAVMAGMDDVLGKLAESVARAILSGPLNEEQSSRLHQVMSILSGLRSLFSSEHARMAAALPPTKES